VPIGEYLHSADMDIRNSCFILDNGEQFCDDDKKLRFFVNGQERSSIMDYVLQDEDRILIIYGDESQQELEAEFDKLENTPIVKQ
jgi:hypothetical protein